ncbi:MAG TPA: hypothetical protein VK183_00530 [Flavobacterium sp.]|nr:hypothetical protein [Flavobacterium sp.]
MKRFFLASFFVIVGLLASCSPDSSSSMPEANMTVSSSAIKDFEIALTTVAPKVQELTQSADFQASPESFEREVIEIMAPLVAPSERLMSEANINASEVPELEGVTLDEGQLVQIGLLIYASETMAQRNSVLECVERAFVGFELHEGFWSQFGNRRLLLRAIGKVATRYLGAIGAILIVADFVDCMGWLD